MSDLITPSQDVVPRSVADLRRAGEPVAAADVRTWLRSTGATVPARGRFTLVDLLAYARATGAEVVSRG